ncbi:MULTISPECIES: hypothetical protein [unclassified Cytobacillus]|uniref:hypothetical protein n=1 Tax=unclassified Cytobacillus TaxID=2675268 RepID=UPI00135B313B|nr:hypothetical protein [Cytobacillus sp. AMY 15.2]KAF0815908.1 hypothetical protein KIS4809_5335 [Bacillus sp. ZZV12-4809]MCM3094462.1 hypothetical protein [Cytobacillus sp. AMY 15.2]
MEGWSLYGYRSTWFDKLFAFDSSKRIGNYQETMLARFPLMRNQRVISLAERMETQGGEHDVKA